MHDVLGNFTVANYLFVAALLAYLYFNTSPSSMLMGDAGSRALGFYIAILAMQSRHPFLYLLMAGVMIVDGGIGLVKVFLLRFLKIAILKNTRTPLHDHVRLFEVFNKGHNVLCIWNFAVRIQLVNRCYYHDNLPFMFLLYLSLNSVRINIAKLCINSAKLQKLVMRTLLGNSAVLKRYR